MAISWSKQFYGIGSEAIIGAINEYYGRNSLLWDRMITGRSSYEEIMTAYDNLPPIDITYALDGHILGIDAKQAMNVTENSNINTMLNSVNSNAQSATYGATKSVVVDIPSNTTIVQPEPQLDPEYGTASGPISNVSGNPISAIADRASLAVAGLSIGSKLGKGFDELLYSINPSWWDEHYPTINPETWSSLCGQSAVGDFFLRTFLGISEDSGKMTQYYDERALAYTYMMLRDNHAFDAEGIEGDYTGSTASFPHSNITSLALYTSLYFENATYQVTITAPSGVYLVPCVSNSSVIPCNFMCVCLYTNTSKYVTTTTYNKTTGQTSTVNTNLATSNYTFNNTRYSSQVVSGVDNAYIYPSISFPYKLTDISGYLNNQKQVATIVLDGTITQNEPLPGSYDLPNSTIPNPRTIDGTTVDQVLQQLKQNYPSLFDGSIKSSVLQDDGTIKEDTYVPVPTPDIDSLDMKQPISGDVEQDNTDISDETLVKIFNDISNKNPTDTDTPDTGTGTGPTVTIPTGNASSLWAVYNPSQSQLNSFGAWLWSSDLVDQIKRLFVDPMQAVIGVHKVFCNVPNGSSATIKCGYIDSGVSAPTVSNQYVQIDCGTVSVNEFYGNVFDYEPYTTIHAYLPFIGVVKLDTGDVMRGSVNITYGVDVITGACLAKIKVSRDGNSGILYSFGGSCAVHYPLSSGSYGGIISGIVSAAVGVGTSVITGNPLATVGGIISGAHQAHFDVSKSGGFTGASGATGPKKPYLIISRPQTSMARGFDVMTGYPANQLVQIKDCEGYIKCKETHIESNTATQEELNTIETMLKNGILI